MEKPTDPSDDAEPRGDRAAERQIGPYRILRELGKGGMGTVYLAEQRTPVRRRVALKVITRGRDTDEFLARFQFERRALAAMSHEHIAKVFDAGATEGGQPYFVMELVEGVPLTEYCDRHRLGLEERIALFQQVCAGVQHAHQKGVIHRDLKPGNVLVVREGERAVAKIIDFGLARATNKATAADYDSAGRLPIDGDSGIVFVLVGRRARARALRRPVTAPNQPLRPDFAEDGGATGSDPGSRAMDSERERFERLVLDHHAAVYRAARRIVRSDADAQDVTQQVFLHAWRRRHALPDDRDGVERVLRWQAGRLALTALRARRRRGHHETEVAMRTTDDGTGTARLPDDERATVRASIDALDDVGRAVVVLRFHEGMTLQAIGEVIGCAESTVHARLSAALDRLRRRLRGAGFALAGAKFESALRQCAADVTVPAGLAMRLLSVPTAAASATFAKLAAVAVLVLGGGGTVLALQGGGHEPTPVAAVVATSELRGAEPEAQDSERRPVPTKPLAPPLGPPPAPAARGTVVPGAAQAERLAELLAQGSARLVGTVVGEGDQAPLAGVEVRAYCRELSRKAEPFVVRATTDAQGRFELQVPVTHDDGVDYRLGVERSDWVGAFATADLRVRNGDDRRDLAASMRRWATDEAGAWQTDVLVTDAAGRPVEGVNVIVHRRQPGDGGGERLVREASGRTDERGRTVLSGTHLGEKLVRAIPWGKPFMRHDVPLAIRAPAPPRIDVVLPADAPLRAVVVDARTGVPVAKAQVQAERGSDTLAVGVSAADGSVALRGLDGEPVRLSGGGGTWSRFQLDDVSPHDGVVRVALKRADDPEPVGLHGSELHGRVVDAATGEPVAVEHGAVGAWWLRADDAATCERILADAIHPFPYQTAAFGDPPPPSPEFHLPLYQPGRVALILRLRGHAVAAAGPFDVAEGQLVNGIVLKVERGARVEVVVRDANGRPVEGAEVWLAAPGDDADRARSGRATESRAPSSRASVRRRAAARGATRRVGSCSSTCRPGSCSRCTRRRPTGATAAAARSRRARRARTCR